MNNSDKPSSSVVGVLDSLFPDGKIRKQVASILATSILKANEVSPGSWALTHSSRKDYICLDVGRIFAISFHNDGRMSVVLNPEGASLEEPPYHTWAKPAAEVEFKSNPNLTWRKAAVSEVLAKWDRLEAAHLDAVGQAAGQVKFSTFARHHRSELCAEVGLAAGVNLPRPAVAEKPGLDVDHLVWLVEREFPGWTGFRDPRFEEGEVTYKHEAATMAAELLSRRAIARLIEQGDFDEVLERLRKVGHATNLLYHGVPAHSDLNIHLQESLDKPGFCKEILELLHGEGDAVERLGIYLGWVESQGLPTRWTYPTYFLFLLHPESEVFIKPRAVNTFLRMIDPSDKLATKPTAEEYSRVRGIARGLFDQLPEYGPSDMIDIQGFIWVCATKKFWKIAPWEQAAFWERQRDGNYIGLGWIEVGDLSDVEKEDDFNQLCAPFIEHGEGWTKEGLKQLWAFRSKVGEGDIIIANRGTTKVVGLGVVTGKYFFEQGAEDGHRLPVRWDDVDQREVAFGGWRRTLLQVSPTDLGKILDSSPSAGSKTWIFQASPGVYDLTRFLSDGRKETTWTVPQHARDLNAGDEAYLWMAGGDRGIVAHGRLKTGAIDRDQIPKARQKAEDQYYIDKNSGPSANQIVDIDLDLCFPQRRILANELKQNSVLKDLRILKQAAGTVFPVSSEQATALTEVVRRHVMPQKAGFSEILTSIRGKGLFFPDDLVANYLLALQTKRFVILTGISGTGKTQLAISVAEEFRSTRDERTLERPIGEGAAQMTVRPYMLKYKRFQIPARLYDYIDWELSEGAVKMGRVIVEFDGNAAEQSFYRSTTDNFARLLLAGDLREWFLGNFAEGDSFVIEILSPDNEGDPQVRLSKPEVVVKKRAVTNSSVVAVRPDWTDHRGLLGYFNPLTARYVSTPFLKLVVAANQEHELARDQVRDPAPFFAVLDEMNLARVEHYFSDLLSCMESDKAIHLHDDEAVAAGDTEDGVVVPKDLDIPPNLFIVGTVNVDETTYMFSPKVLDRAFTIELNEVDLGGYAKGGLAAADGEIKLPMFEGLAGEWKKPDTADWRKLGDLSGGKFQKWIVRLNGLLEADGRHFGYRVADEISRFVTLAAEQSGNDNDAILAAFDLAVLQKVLPKMNGTQQELHDPVAKLFAFAMSPAGGWGQHSPVEFEMKGGGFISKQRAGGESESADAASPAVQHPELPRTARKLWRMARRLKQRGFASYIE